MGAFEEFTDLIRQTATMQALVESLEKEPAKLLTAVCREYEVTTEAVPDDHLNLAGYSGEAMLRALVSADLITRGRGGRSSLYGYKPTKEGLKYYRAMVKEKKV